ncbi:MAG: hypothetical protein AAFO70_08545, partial [Pseudomonadota bacterium]
PGVSIGYERLFGDDFAERDFTIAGSPTVFNAMSARESRDRLKLAFTSDFQVNDRVDFRMSIDSRLSEDRRDVTAKGLFKIKF